MENDNLKEIYKVEAEKYNKTRDIQWKMNLAFWTLLIVAIYAKTKHELRIPISAEISAGVLFIVFHLLFVLHIHGSLERSLNRMHNMANFLLGNEVVPNKSLEYFEIKKISLSLGWHILQIAITTGLVIMFIFLNR
jgi:hypothetical protein